MDPGRPPRSALPSAAGVRGALCAPCKATIWRRSSSPGSPEIAAALISLMIGTGAGCGPLPPPRLEGAHFPVPDAIAAGLALQSTLPPFRARSSRGKVAALDAIVPVGGRRAGGDGAAGASVRIFPRPAGRGNRAASLWPRSRPARSAPVSAPVLSAENQVDGTGNRSDSRGRRIRIGPACRKPRQRAQCLRWRPPAANPVSPSLPAAAGGGG